MNTSEIKYIYMALAAIAHDMERDYRDTRCTGLGALCPEELAYRQGRAVVCDEYSWRIGNLAKRLENAMNEAGE